MPCECERLAIERAVLNAIDKALDAMGARLDWRKDCCDFAELAEKVSGAVEYGLCDDCARERAREMAAEYQEES